MSKSNGALSRGRELMRHQRTFSGKEPRELLAAGLDSGFDPEHNTIDAQIEKFLIGTHGQRWRTVGQPPQPEYTPEEAAAIAAAERDVEAKRQVHDRVHDQWTDAVRRANDPPRPVEAAEWARLHRRAEQLARAKEEPRHQLEEAIAHLTALKMLAQRRRADEILARASQ